MFIGTTTDLYKDINKEKQSITDLGKIGFDAFDYSYFFHDSDDSLYLKDNFREYAKDIYDIVKGEDKFFSQMHAPMLGDFFEEKNEARKLELTYRSFEVCSILKSPYNVIHLRKVGEGMTIYEKEKSIENNKEFLSDLLPYAKKFNVKIALENLFSVDKRANKIIASNRCTAQEINMYIDTFSKENFVACLDTGHARLTGQSPADLARVFGDNLKVLHLHDNFALSDDHLFPYFGIIDWQDFLESLKEIKYDGVLSMEANSLYGNIPEGLAIPSAKYLLEIGKNMSEYFK